MLGAQAVGSGQAAVVLVVAHLAEAAAVSLSLSLFSRGSSVFPFFRVFGFFLFQLIFKTKLRVRKGSNKIFEPSQV